MTGFTSLKAITLITKLYTGYAYSLAFIFQSSLVLIMAAISTGIFIHLSKHHRNTIPQRLIGAPLHTARHTDRISRG